MSTREAPDEYSVGPLSNSTWLTLYAMLSEARADAPDFMWDDYNEAVEEFLASHPDGVIGDPAEDWSKETRQAWDEMVTSWIEEESQ